MLFNSVPFLIFFPIVVLLYWVLPTQKFRVGFLLLASLYFYMSWNPLFSILLGIITLISYFGGLLLGTTKVPYRKAIATISICLIALSLLFYKYYSFIADCLTNFLTFVGIRIDIPGFNILLPLGISFFTFKAISYVVDVYKRKVRHEQDFIDYATYICFFPQIVAGPIDRADNLIPQFKRKLEFDGSYISKGAKMMLWGYFLKVVFANRACIYVDVVYDNIANHNGTTLLLTAVLYSFQIYCDFAGYSLISIGCAKAMGYDVADNFRRPYFAFSVTDFWKRWHISLTKWLTEYIYFPLGGNRCSKIKNRLNIMIVFLVSGLWHGAAWNFVIWGAIHGVLQIIEKTTGFAKLQCASVLGRIGRVMLTFLLVSLAWVFFRLPDFMDGVDVVVKIFTSCGKPFITGDATSALEFCVLSFSVIILKEFTDEYYPNRFNLLNNKNIFIRFVAYISLCLLILMCGVFDDSQFIYAQF